jgi:8-oxo-dGTP pyrophosphatase MutT (NUDIX family)
MTLTPANPHLHVTVAAIIEKDSQFLMVEEIDNAKPVYNQPAGHVEPDESLLAAVIRETLEETSWHFQPESLIGVYRWQLPGSNEIYLRHCFSGKAIRQDTDRQLDSGILRTVWLSLAELQQQVQRLRSPLVLACLEDYVAGQRYPLSLYRDLG